MYKELVKYANEQENKKLPIQIDWILDEFANCPLLNDIESVVSVARSRGMRFNFFIQSFAQLNRVYGKDTAQIILDNCGLIFLKTNTQETADEISKRLGKKTIRIHDFRHSCASLLIDSGANITLVAKYLGHTKIDETLNTYSHMYRNRLENIVQIIEVQNTKLLDSNHFGLPDPKHKIIELPDAKIIKKDDNKKETEKDLTR